jgi:hydrolase, TatD family
MSMKIIDTHSHIYSSEFDSDRHDIIQRAKIAGVKAVLLPNENSGTIATINRLCNEEPEFAYPMIGLHPTCVDRSYINELKLIEDAVAKHKYYAIGEIGIDLYWDKTYFKEQQSAFEEQLYWSIDMQLPVSVHMRNSFYETLEIIHKVGADKLKGVFHCFGGTIDAWNEISGLSNFYIGVGGIVTFKNNELHHTLGNIPLDRIVLETDAPYLAPSPYRGKRNEPAYILETAKTVAECHKTTTENITNYTYRNSLNLFNISPNSIDV